MQRREVSRLLDLACACASSEDFDFTKEDERRRDLALIGYSKGVPMEEISRQHLMEAGNIPHLRAA